jgi:hypothetical protein
MFQVCTIYGHTVFSNVCYGILMLQCPHAFASEIKSTGLHGFLRAELVADFQSVFGTYNKLDAELKKKSGMRVLGTSFHTYIPVNSGRTYLAAGLSSGI